MRISRFGWIGCFPKIHSTYPIIPNRRMLLLLFVCRLGWTGWTIFTDQDFCHRDGINWGKRRLKSIDYFLWNPHNAQSLWGFPLGDAALCTCGRPPRCLGLGSSGRGSPPRCWWGRSSYIILIMGSSLSIKSVWTLTRWFKVPTLLHCKESWHFGWSCWGQDWSWDMQDFGGLRPRQ